MPKLQDYLVLAVVVRELSQAPVCFLFDCCVFIVRFASLSCYSSSKTRIRPVKLYQINKSFCSITCWALLCLVYHLITILTCFRCPELKVCPLSSLHCFFFESEPKPALESHFLNLQSHFPITFLYAILLY